MVSNDDDVGDGVDGGDDKFVGVSFFIGAYSIRGRNIRHDMHQSVALQVHTHKHTHHYTQTHRYMDTHRRTVGHRHAYTSADVFTTTHVHTGECSICGSCIRYYMHRSAHIHTCTGTL
jgi:hypothetical protein